MSLFRALKGRRGNRRFQKQLHEALLVFDRQADDLRFVDCPMCHFLSGGNHEIAETAALELRGPPDNSERTGRNASFDPRGAIRFLGLRARLLSRIVRDSA